MKPKTKAKTGARGKYTPERIARIRELLVDDTYTINEICQQVGITRETYYQWEHNFADFSDMIKSANAERMQNLAKLAAKSLRRLVDGYEVEETSVTHVDDGSGKPRIKEKKTTKKHFQPNATAVIFALKNGDPENFKDRQEVDHTTGGQPMRIVIGQWKDE